MITLQYVISSILLIFPFIIAGIIEAVYDKLFLKRGKVLDLPVSATPAFSTTGLNFRSVFSFDSGGAREAIGSENPLVFYVTDAGVVPTSLGDYKNTLEVKFLGSFKFNVILNGGQIATGDFETQGKREYLYNQNILYQYNYGQWLALTLAAVFGISVLRILYKEVTISNIVQAATKFRVGSKGIDTSMEEGEGFTVIKLMKGIFNTLGWIVSFFVFPNSNLMFFISFLVIFTTFTVSFIITMKSFGHRLQDDFTSQDKAILGACFVGILVLFVSFRYFSDRTDPEKSSLSSDSSLVRSRAMIGGNVRSGADASVIARSIA